MSIEHAHISFYDMFRFYTHEYLWTLATIYDADF